MCNRRRTSIRATDFKLDVEFVVQVRMEGKTSVDALHLGRTASHLWPWLSAPTTQPTGMKANIILYNTPSSALVLPLALNSALDHETLYLHSVPYTPKKSKLIRYNCLLEKTNTIVLQWMTSLKHYGVSSYTLFNTYPVFSKLWKLET